MTQIEDPLVSIIIINLNGRSFLNDCFEAILNNTYKNYEIILVDNKSNDGSIEFVKERFPATKIIELDKNYGYAEPCNIGAKQAKGNLFYFLNNDTKISANSLTELVKSINVPDVAICQSLLLKPDGTIDSSGDFITTSGLSYRSFEKVSTKKPILSARGASMLIKKELFWKLGGFDKKFFASFEDVDLGWRAWIYGYKVIIVPTSIVYHKGGSTVKTIDSTIRFHGVKNTLALCITNFETLFVLKSLLNLFCIAVTKKVPSSELRRDSEEIFNLPSFRITLQGIKWVLRNFRYVSNKRKKVNSQRVRSTKELIELGLITKSRN